MTLCIIVESFVECSIHKLRNVQKYSIVPRIRVSRILLVVCFLESNNQTSGFRDEFRPWFPQSLHGTRVIQAVSDSFYFCCSTRDSEHEEDDLAEPEFRGLWEENENSENKVKLGFLLSFKQITAMCARNYSVRRMFLYSLAD